MYEFPIDKNFVAAIKSYPNDCEEAAWREILMNENSAIFDYLYSKGFPRKTVKGFVKTLKNIPAERLLKLAVIYESLYFPMLYILRRSKSKEVFEKAVELSISPDCEERDLSIILLSESPGSAFIKKAEQALINLISKEKDAIVLASAINGLSSLALSDNHEQLSENYDYLKPHINHSNPKVRQAVASSLITDSDDWILDSLKTLTQDIDREVRNWATQSLSSSIEFIIEFKPEFPETKLNELKDVLAKRLTDELEDTRIEGIRGLALLKDNRANEAIKKELKSEIVHSNALEVARNLADPNLYQLLRRIKPAQTWDIETLEEAIESCSGKTVND